MTPEQIVKRPLVLTEKARSLSENDNIVVFEVNKAANKIQIRQAIEQLFSVKVIDVNTLIVRGRTRRVGRGFAKAPNWKKAMVKLQPGTTIQFFQQTEESEK